MWGIFLRGRVSWSSFWVFSLFPCVWRLSCCSIMDSVSVDCWRSCWSMCCLRCSSPVEPLQTVDGVCLETGKQRVDSSLFNHSPTLSHLLYDYGAQNMYCTQSIECWGKKLHLPAALALPQYSIQCRESTQGIMAVWVLHTLQWNPKWRSQHHTWNTEGNRTVSQLTANTRGHLCLS